MTASLLQSPSRNWTPKQVFGIDYSGARLSGQTAWVAHCEVPQTSDSQWPTPSKLRLVRLDPAGRLAGGDGRDAVNAMLVRSVEQAQDSLFGFDFPFGLPVELGLGNRVRQLRLVAKFDGDAREFGRFLVAIAMRIGPTMHIRRQTDRETQTPFDCYHYRIIHQTFHGMKSVLGPLAKNPLVAVDPFPSSRSSEIQITNRVVEACPSSTLRRMGLPRRLYKQTAGKPPTEVHLANRQTILRGLAASIRITPSQRRLILSNPGGDALDAVIAAVGVHHAWHHDDHRQIAAHPRYPKEGRVYA